LRISGELALVLAPHAITGDGSCNNNGLLLEAPDPISKMVWDNAIALAPATAKRLGFSTGDIVEVPTDHATLPVPVQVQPGVHAEAAVLTLGWGRNSVGTIGNEVGVNGYRLASVRGSEIGFAGLRIRPKKIGSGYQLACTQDHYYIEGRSIIREQLLGGFVEGHSRGAEEETPPSLTL
jgi:hypothetical protein